ncbi:hypothetical protein [Streptomyces melanogenes]|uniref:Integral membrane protein n=1 Tax=Streptomyces melanogenes TaxID=67326 RepID=A0ABZ1XNA0_9ACTN|nr:hypothetical protein [Streptomyces melanogenes]
MPEQPVPLAWQLRAGVRLDAKYRNAVINELYEHEERVAAPLLDADTATVLTDALEARRTALLWALPTALVWIAGFFFAGWLFSLYAAGCAALFGAAVVLGDRTAPLPASAAARRPGPAARLAGGALRALGRSVLLGYAVLAVPTARSADWPTAAAAFGGPALLAAVTWAHRTAIVKRLGRVTQPHASVEQPRSLRLGRITQLLRAEQGSALVVNRPGTPFPGSGRVVSSVGLTVDVRGRTDGLFAPALLTRVARAVREMPHFVDQVDEVFLLPEERAPARHPLARSPYWPHDTTSPSARPGTRWLRIVSRSPGPHLTTVFVQIRRDGRFLSIEQSTCVLPPVRRDFTHLPGSRYDPYDSSQRPASGVQVLSQVLVRSPLASATLLAELATWSLRQVRRMSSPPSGRPPSGPHTSIRELAAEPDLPALAAADAERISRAVRLLVLDTVRAALRDQGLSAPGLDEDQAEVYGVQSGGIHIGNISPGTLATGYSARARGTTSHTSPGPTTNPDDDSWEDDDDLG